MPLFSYPLSGLEVYPSNCLRVCRQKYLVASRYHLGEFDVSVFGPKDGAEFEIEGVKKWGFFHDGGHAKLLRFKGK